MSSFELMAMVFQYILTTLQAIAIAHDYFPEVKSKFFLPSTLLTQKPEDLSWI